MITKRVLSATIALGFFTLISAPLTANAWGRRGHAIVCETAADLLAKKPGAAFLKNHSFDLAYYCNVPDFVWKKPATYATEMTNHFMDLDVFERAFKGSQVAHPFELDRLEFNKAFPEVKDSAGRAYWRVREIESILTKTTESLKSASLSGDVKKAAQADWLVQAGVIGHYIGDLSQPLHVTENFDGQATDQKGVHAYFEDTVVDALYAGLDGNPSGQFAADVAKVAAKSWALVSAKSDKAATLALMQSLADSSSKELAGLLMQDKRAGRSDVAKAARVQRERIMQRLAAGAVVLAQIWSKQLGWEFDETKFYNFVTEPSYIAPPTSVPVLVSPGNTTSKP